MALFRAETDIETYEIHSEVISRIIHRYKEILLDRNITICDKQAKEYFQIRTQLITTKASELLRTR